MSYSGYLSPHVDMIMKMYRSGAKQTEISRRLYSMGVRPFWADDPRHYFGPESLAQLVGYVIRKHSKPKKPAKVTKIVQDWQTWTPEMQAAEFAAGYA
jgi:hypothetical protein